MRPDYCAKTGYPPYNSAGTALKAGTKLVRHPLDTVVFVDKCEGTTHYHFIVVNRRDIPGEE
jgi:hypothetical protein